MVVLKRAALYGLVHALVDCSCGFLIFYDLGSAGRNTAEIIALVLLYNALAFGGQLPVGLLADHLRRFAALASAGLFAVALALLLAPSSLLAAVLMAGLGNALFHVGAGARVLEASRGASESGIFVGPGALGLAAGLWMGGQALPARPWLLLGLLLAPLLFLQATPILKQTRQGAAALPVWLGLLILSLLGSVMIRAMLGSAVAGSWRAQSTTVPFMLAAGASLGKSCGGLLGDRLGWLALSLGALLISAPLLSFWGEHASAAVLGMILFQMTMPITLKATHQLLPERPGLAFGAPCLALLLGALPGMLGQGVWLDSSLLFLLLSALSALLLALALSKLSPPLRSPGLALKGRG